MLFFLNYVYPFSVLESREGDQINETTSQPEIDRAATVTGNFLGTEAMSENRTVFCNTSIYCSGCKCGVKKYGVH